MYIKDTVIVVLLAILTVATISTFYIAFNICGRWIQSEGYIAVPVVHAEHEVFPIPNICYTYDIDNERFENTNYFLLFKDSPEQIFVNSKNSTESFPIKYSTSANVCLYSYVCLAIVISILLFIAWYSTLSM